MDGSQLSAGDETRSRTEPAGTDLQGTDPLFVSHDSVMRIFAWRDVIEQLRAAYSTPQGRAAAPRRSMARADGGIWMRSQIAAPAGCRYMGAKLFAFGREREVNYPIVLFEQQSGRFAGIVDGAPITAFRTAATSALAVDRLARADPLRLGIIGSGLEARHHVEAIAAVRPVASLKVFSPTAANRDAFARDFAEKLKVPCAAAESPEEATRGANLIVAAARSRDESPTLRGAWLEPGRMVVSIGSTLPEQREIDADVVAAADIIVCDMVDEVVAETGDMLAARAAGVEFEHKLLSLNDAMQADCDARVRAARLPLFKSVGSGLQDVVVAAMAFEKARAQGLARPMGVELFTRFAAAPGRAAADPGKR